MPPATQTVPVLCLVEPDLSGARGGNSFNGAPEEFIRLGASPMRSVLITASEEAPQLLNSFEALRT